MNPKLASNASALLLFCFRPEKFNLPPGSRQIGDFLRRSQLVDFVFHQKFMRFKSNEYANWWRALRVIDVELRRRFFARASVKVTRSPPPSLCENAKNNKKLFAAAHYSLPPPWALFRNVKKCALNIKKNSAWRVWVSSARHSEKHSIIGHCNNFLGFGR